jgi:hypothetical protein
MASQSFSRALGGTLALDLCFSCQAIWFDHDESTQLAPGGAIDLFKQIQAHRDTPRTTLSSVLNCPRCSTRLAYTRDMVRSNAITYYRCEFCRGRLTVFLQFLREKQFVRSLTEPEIATLRAQVQQIRCSGCGAAIDLGNDSACPYCRAPISMLDAEAVDKALRTLQQAETERVTVDPARVAEALAGIALDHSRSLPWPADNGRGADLVSLGIDALLTLIEAR